MTPSLDGLKVNHARLTELLTLLNALSPDDRAHFQRDDGDIKPLPGFNDMLDAATLALARVNRQIARLSHPPCELWASRKLTNRPADVSASTFEAVADSLLGVGYDQALADMLSILARLAGEHGCDFPLE